MSILTRCTRAELSSNSQSRHLIYRDGNTAARRDHRATYFIQRMDAGIRANEVSFAAALDVIRPDCEIGGLQCSRNVGIGETIADKFPRIRLNNILLFIAAERVDV